MLERIKSNFLSRINAIQQESAGHLLAGRCRDYADYKFAIGKLKGLKDAEEAIETLYKEMISHEEVKPRKVISYDREPQSY